MKQTRTKIGVLHWFVFAGFVSAALIAPARGAPAHQPPVTFEPKLGRLAKTSMAIYDASGKLVRTLWQTAAKKPGDRVTWDGKDDRGRALPAGDYGYRTLQLPESGVTPGYIATVGNGIGSEPAQLGGVVGMIPYDVKTDASGNIYISGTGHGRSAQKFDRRGKMQWISNRPAPGTICDQASALAVGDRYLYLAGPTHVWRVNRDDGQAVPWPDGSPGKKLPDPPPYNIDENIDRFADTQRLWVHTLYQGTFWWPSALAGIDGWQGPFHSNTKHDGNPVGVGTRGMAILGGELFLALTLLNKVQVRDIDTGDLVRTFDLDAPAGMVADDESGKLLIVSGRSVVRCDRDGSGAVTVVDAELNMPWGLARNRVVGKLYVSDQYHDGKTGHKIKVFDETTGRLVENFGADDQLDGPIVANELFAPAGLDIDPSQRIIVAEHMLYRISAFSSNWQRELEVYGGAFFEAAFADPKQPKIMYGIDGWFQGAIREYEIDYDRQTWRATKFWFHGGPHPTRDMTGGAMYGSRIMHINGTRYMATSMDCLRIYRITPDRLVPVTIIGQRFRVKTGSSQYEPASAMAIWTDRNGDEVATPDEINYAPKELRDLPHFHIGYNYFDVDPEPDGTLYWYTYKLPLRGQLDNGALVYDWRDTSHFRAAFDAVPVGESAISTDGDVNNDDRYLALMTLDNSRQQPGIGYWQKRMIECYLQKYSADGKLKWQVGSKARGVHAPGEMYHPSGIETISVGYPPQTFVLVNDEPGPVHIWSGDGLYVATVLIDMSSDWPGLDNFRKYYKEPKWLSHPLVASAGELWYISALVHPRTEKVYLYTQAHEMGEHMRIYELKGLDAVTYTNGPAR